MKCLLNISPPALFGLRASEERERGGSVLDIQSGFRKLMDGLTDECYGSVWNRGKFRIDATGQELQKVCV